MEQQKGKRTPPLKTLEKQRGTIPHLTIENLRNTKETNAPAIQNHGHVKGETCPTIENPRNQRGTIPHNTELYKLLPAILLYIG